VAAPGERGELKVDQLVHLFFFQQVIGVDGRGNDLVEIIEVGSFFRLPAHAL
jgi:hypothetical protein